MKIASRLIFYFLTAVLILGLLLQFGPIQTYTTKQIFALVSTQSNHQITISKAHLTWIDHVLINDLLILDLQQDTLIYAEEIDLNYKILDLLNQNFLNLESIKSTNFDLNLIKHDSVSKLNLSLFIESLSSGKKGEVSRVLRIDELAFDGFEFTIDDRTKERKYDRIDFGHLEFQSPDFQLADLSLRGDSMQTKIIQAIGTENFSGFSITNFQSDLQLNNQSLSLTNINFKTQSSQITDSLKFYYNGIHNLSNFVDSVGFGVYLSNSILSKEDISLFVGENNLKSSISFDGMIWGSVGDFNVENSRIGFGEESFIEGGLSCFGLPNIQSTFILADVTNSHLVADDVQPYVGKLASNIAELGEVDFTGSFAGFVKDFVARGDFITGKGSIHSDINVKIPDDPSQMSYSGNLELRSVDLGAVLDNRKWVQNVNLKGRINGKGITKRNANFDLDAVIFHSGFNGYEFDTIRANGHFASKIFKGTFSVDDPNCELSGYADLDLEQEDEILKLDLNLSTGNLRELNFTQDSLVTGGKIRLDIVDLDIDRFVGTAAVDSAFVQLNDRSVEIDSINFLATLNNGVRRMKLSLPEAFAELHGKFKVSDAVVDLTKLYNSYLSKIRLQEDTIVKRPGVIDYSMELYAEVGDLSRYFDALSIPLEISDGAFLEASFRESKNANLFLYGQADLVKLGENTFREPVLEVNGSKEIGAKGVLTNFIFESDFQEFAGIPETKNLLIEGIWFNEQIDLSSAIQQESTESDFRLETTARLLDDSIVVKMNPSRIIAFGEQWNFNPMNQITYSNSQITIKDFELRDQREQVKLEGVLGLNDSSMIEIFVQNLQLDKTNLFSEIDVDGSLNAETRFFRSSSTENFQFDGEFKVNSFTLRDFLVGNIRGDAKWNQLDESISSSIVVDRENFKSIDLNGNYFPLRERNQLDFELAFDQADVRLLAPFVEKYVSNLSGYATGRLAVNGSLSKPEVNGRCEISAGEIKINYLNTYYQFAGDVKFEPNAIVFNRFEMTDRKKERAFVTGSIKHDFYKNIVTSIVINTENFEFLNTTSLDNSLYYGSANGTGRVAISGPLNDLLIKASVRTDRNTNFFVPVSEGGEVSQQDYIAFVDFGDTTSVVQSASKKIRGLTLDFDIEVTPDAYCELIFDIKTGDIIRGRGRGNIKLTLDTDGEFHMFGPLEIIDGAYNFTVPGFINKEFIVSPGSLITWFGDPYNAMIDLDATYLQRASFEPLKVDENDGEGEFDDRVGMNVLLNLSGRMLAPAIEFDLQIADPIDQTTRRQSKLTQITNDEQELKRQVISLLFFKRFSPLSSFTLGGGGNVGNSVSEFFSNQVSYLVSQLDENLEVEVDLASLDKEAFNTFQLRLAYTFLDGRLKVTRGGDFQNEAGAGDRLLEDIVGDWSVEYSLTKDGRLRAKVFRATNQQLSADLGIQNFETGLSLRFVHSFNEFSELLSEKRKEAIRRREEENPQPAESPSEAPYR